MKKRECLRTFVLTIKPLGETYHFSLQGNGENNSHMTLPMAEGMGNCDPSIGLEGVNQIQLSTEVPTTLLKTPDQLYLE